MENNTKEACERAMSISGESSKILEETKTLRSDSDVTVVYKDQFVAQAGEITNSTFNNKIDIHNTYLQCGNQFPNCKDFNSDENFQQILKSVNNVKALTSENESKIDEYIQKKIPVLRQEYKTKHGFLRSLLWAGKGYDYPVEDYFIDLEINKYDRLGQKIFDKNIPLEAIFGDEDTKTILVTGDAGFGKTTLRKKLSYDWAKKLSYMSRFDVAISIALRKLINMDIMTTIFNILFEKEKMPLTDALKRSKLNFLIMLDGFDEMSEKGTVFKFVKERSDNMTILLTSRLHAIEDIKVEFERRISICGFSKENQRKYVELTDSKYSIGNVNVLLSKLKSGLLSNLAKCPLILHMLCCLHKDVDLNSLKGLAGLYIEMFRLFTKRYEIKYRGTDLSFLKEGTWFLGEDLLFRLGMSAGYYYLSNTIVITSDILKEQFPDEKEYNFVTRLDLLIATPTTSTGGKEVTQFEPLYKTFFEFLTSLCTSKLKGYRIFLFSERKDITGQSPQLILIYRLELGHLLRLSKNSFLFISGLMENDYFIQSVSEVCNQVNNLREFECFYRYLDALKKDNYDLWKQCCSKFRIIQIRFSESMSYDRELLEHCPYEKIIIFYEGFGSLIHSRLSDKPSNSEDLQPIVKRMQEEMNYIIKKDSLVNVVLNLTIDYEFYRTRIDNTVTYCYDIRFILDIFLNLFIKLLKQKHLEISVNSLNYSQDTNKGVMKGLLTRLVSMVYLRYKTNNSELENSSGSFFICQYVSENEYCEKYPDKSIYIVSNDQFDIINDHFEWDQYVKVLDDITIKQGMKYKY